MEAWVHHWRVIVEYKLHAELIIQTSFFTVLCRGQTKLHLNILKAVAINILSRQSELKYKLEIDLVCSTINFFLSSSKF